MSTIKITDVNFTFDILGRNREEAVKIFIGYINESNEDSCLDIEEKHEITDEEARNIKKNLCRINNMADMQKFDISKRNANIKELKETCNLSIRQIENLTGINRGIVLRA